MNAQSDGGYRSTKQIISTLGPNGTCSEIAVGNYIYESGMDAEVCLLPTFEDCINALRDGQADLAFVPAAYVNFHKITFEHIGHLEIVCTVIERTPDFVLAGRDHTLPHGHYRVACHESPSPLLSQLPMVFPLLSVDIDLVQSNSVAAQTVAEAHHHICITNRAAADRYGLKVLHDFGSIYMLWAGFKWVN